MEQVFFCDWKANSDNRNSSSNNEDDDNNKKKKIGLHKLVVDCYPKSETTHFTNIVVIVAPPPSSPHTNFAKDGRKRNMKKIGDGKGIVDKGVGTALSIGRAKHPLLR